MTSRLRIAGAIGLAVVAALAIASAGWTLSKSRTHQLFGELVTHVETADSVVALTFDDGPAPLYTDSVLALLADSNVRATFFVVGSAIERDPDIAVRIRQAGHELGNHSYSHQRMVLNTPGFVRRELGATDSLIRAAGYTGGIQFRPPYGKRLVVLPWVLSREDRPVVLADVEPDSDSRRARDAAAMVAFVRRRVRPGSIIVLHVEMPSRGAGREALPGIIGGLRGAGYEFVTVSELSERGRYGRGFSSEGQR